MSYRTSGASAQEKKKRPEDDFQLYPYSKIELPYIRRIYWYGLKPQDVYVSPMDTPHEKVCFVSSETAPCTTLEECVKEVQEIQKRNMILRDWPDIPFNFLIGGDGHIYEGRGWLMKYQNIGNPAMQETLQIAYIGKYKDKDPPPEMVDLGALLIQYGKERKMIAENYSYMECPLNEYYLFPEEGLEAYLATPEYKELKETLVDGPPPPPPKELLEDLDDY